MLIYLYLVDLEYHKDTKYSHDYQFIQHVSYPELRLLCALALNIHSINAQIKGKVLDGKTMMLLQGVNIYMLQDTVAIGITNQQGEFKTTHSNRINPKDTIVFSYVGYHAVKCTTADLEKSAYQIVMNESSQLLNEVSVSRKRKPYFLDVEYLSSLPRPLYSYGGFLLNGDIYTVAGDETMEIYDMKKDTFYIDPVNPHQAANFTSFIYDDNLYVMGGSIKKKVFSNKIHALDLKKGIWYEISDTIPKEWCGEMNGILVGHTVYIFGGYRTTPMWTAASYDLKEGKWKQLCDMKDGVAYPGLATDGKRIYILENKYLQVYKYLIKISFY